LRASRGRISVEGLEPRTLLSGPGPLEISEFLADSSAGLADEYGD
jgi:hypothetical protein